MNVELLLKVKAKILEEPAQFIMQMVFARQVSLTGRDLPREIPNCGTAACILGWADSIATGKTPAKLNAGRGLCGNPLDVNPAQQHRLYDLDGWPEYFRTHWLESSTLEGRALVAAERIDHFIATDGHE